MGSVAAFRCSVVGRAGPGSRWTSPTKAKPRPRTVREIKLACDSGPRPELTADDFRLRRQLVDLFEHFDDWQEMAIDVLEVKHGLPFRMIVQHG